MQTKNRDGKLGGEKRNQCFALVPDARRKMVRCHQHGRGRGHGRCMEGVYAKPASRRYEGRCGYTRTPSPKERERPVMTHGKKMQSCPLRRRSSSYGRRCRVCDSSHVASSLKRRHPSSRSVQSGWTWRQKRERCHPSIFLCRS